MGQAGGLADVPRAPSDPDDHGRPAAGPPPAPPERSWQGLAVGLAVGIAVVLLLIAVVVVSSGGGDDEATGTATTATTVAPAASPSSTASAGQPSETGGPPTTRKPTPLSIIAANDQRVVVLDQSGATAPRVLFDLGPSSPNDQQPSVIGGISLSNDASSAFFDVVGHPIEGAMKRVSVAGGPAQDIGAGVAPVPSPDNTMLALIQAPEPDVPASLVVRPLAGGSERRFDLGEGTCGNIAWNPMRREVVVDLCSGGEPISVAVIDVATGGMRTLSPPDGTTWSTPAFKPDGTLTLVEQRETDAAVVALNADRSAVATTILRRPSASINTIDWSAAGDLVVCDGNAIVLAAIGGARVEQVAAGYTSAAW